MSTLIQQRVDLCRAGQNPATLYRMPSGWAVLADLQYLSGYSILLADPVVGDLNTLDTCSRSRFLLDMAILGDALMEVTNSYRINYCILGNSDPALHAHVVPRYLDEPEEVRKGLPFDYYTRRKDPIKFDPDRDRVLMQKIAAAIQKRL